MYPHISFQIIAEKSRLAELAKKSPLFETVLSEEAKSLEHLEKLLLEKGDAHKEEMANTVTEGGDSLLMLAIYKGHFDKALLLMKSGARVDTMNRDNVGVTRILTVRFRASLILNNDIGYTVKFLYHLLCEAKGNENIRKVAFTGVTEDLNDLGYLLYQISYLCKWDGKDAQQYFSYFYEIFKKLFALKASPEFFPDGHNIFSSMLPTYKDVTFNIVLELIKIYGKDAARLLSQVVIKDLIFYERLRDFVIKAISKVWNKPGYLSAIKILFESFKNQMEQYWRGDIVSSYQELAQKIYQEEEETKKSSELRSCGVNFFNLDDLLEYLSSKSVESLELTHNFWSFGLSGEFETLPISEDKLLRFLNNLKKVENIPSEIIFDGFSLFSENVSKLICLLPINSLIISISGRRMPKELSRSPAKEITLRIEDFSVLPNALDVFKHNKNTEVLGIGLTVQSTGFSYDSILEALITFFEHNKTIEVVEVGDPEDNELMRNCLIPLYPKKNQPDEISEKQKEILERIEQLFFHLSTCTNLSEFTFPLFYGDDPNVRKKVEECILSNYAIINYGYNKGDIFVTYVRDKVEYDFEQLACGRNRYFMHLLYLFNQWVGLFSLDPKFQIPSSKELQPKVRGLEDDDVEMEPEPQEHTQTKTQDQEPDGKRAKEESIILDRDSKCEKEMKTAKEPQNALAAMDSYAKALAPAIKEKLFQAMIDEIPKIEEKYRNECCYILATKFLLDRLKEEDKAAKILKLIQAPHVTIDPWYLKAQDTLSFIVNDPKPMLAHRLECRDENSNGVIPRLISSMHTYNEDEEGDAIMDLAPPPSYNLSLTGPSIAEFVDYSSKQYLATVKEKRKTEKELKRTTEAKEKVENDLQIMQARLEQMMAEKDAETKRLQEKNAELEQLQKRVAELEALNGDAILRQNIVQPKLLSFSCDAPSSSPLNSNLHKRKADELNNGEAGKKEEEGRVTKRIKTHNET